VGIADAIETAFKVCLSNFLKGWPLTGPPEATLS